MHRMSAFDDAVSAIVNGDEPALRSLLAAHPALVRDRSTEPHRATLLHYVGANGIEPQRSPPNAPAIARILLEAGADPDAEASIYDPRFDTALCLAVTSAHTWLAGVQADLIDALADHGARLDDGFGCALLFGYRDAAERLVLRGARVDNLVYAAGIGRTDEVRGYLERGQTGSIPRRDDDRAGRFSFPVARDADARAAALSGAAMHGRLWTVRALLDAGVPINATPWRGQTALHFAACCGRGEVIDELLARGANPTTVDDQTGKTAAGWA